MILPDHEIKRLARKGMIRPFKGKQISDGIISYGLSSYGYDARVDRQFKLFLPPDRGSNIIDPKKFNSNYCYDIEADVCVIPPNGFALARTVETFSIPRDIMAICMGKSTYARCGLLTNITPLEPEWTGTVTLEFSNTTPFPIRIYAGEGVCQFLFFRAESICDISYADRKGKYQNQSNITLPKIKK
jgi:dCTP deaminase